MIGPDKWIERLAEEARILSESRMIRDDQSYTPELGQLVVARFQEFLKRTGKSQESAARSLGIGAATLSQVLSGSYPGAVGKHVRALDAWLETQLLREHAPRPAGFVKIKVAEQIEAVAKWVQKINGIGVVHGPAGIGKTISALAVRAVTPGSAYLSIKTAGPSTHAVLQLLASALRVSEGMLPSWHLFQQLEAMLKDTNRLIIVDEAHKLVEKRQDEAMHVLRDLHDATGCPMLWLGMSNLADYIQLGKSRYEPLDQLHSRIKVWLDLKEVAMREDGGSGLYTVDCIQKILAQSKLRLSSDAVGYLRALANQYGSGALRTVSTLLQTAAGMRNLEGQTITADILRDIRAKLIGRRAADAFDQAMEVRAMAAAG